MSQATVLAGGDYRRPSRCLDHPHPDAAFGDKAAHPWRRGPDGQTSTHLKTRQKTGLGPNNIRNQIASVRGQILYLSSQNSHVPESLIKSPFVLLILLQI